MEEIKVTKLGSSLPVPCVQELAKEALTKVPPRYVRLDQDPPFVSDTSSLPKVPVIDMQSLTSKDLMDKELEKLHHACKHWGFFQLINHGVSTSLLENVKLGIQEFFNLPMEEKKKFSQQTGDIEGFGQAFVVSEEQKLDWADMFYMITLPVYLRKPHLFPKLPLPFRDTLEAYSLDLKALAMKILDLMAKALKMEAVDMKVLFEEGHQAMRMNYYPPCPQPELAIGLNSHSDAVGLTILLQINEMEGLQIRQNGMWIPVKPLQNAFVVNIGDILEIVTNGIYRSIEHRATVNSECERLSIATFYSPKLDGDMGPAPSLVKPERPALFKPPVLLILAVISIFLGTSWYFSYEEAVESAEEQMGWLLLATPIVLLILVRWLSSMENPNFLFSMSPWDQRRRTHHRPSEGSSPWGVAALIVLLLVMVQYRSVFTDGWLV